MQRDAHIDSNDNDPNGVNTSCSSDYNTNTNSAGSSSSKIESLSTNTNGSLSRLIEFFPDAPRSILTQYANNYDLNEVNLIADEINESPANITSWMVPILNDIP